MYQAQLHYNYFLHSPPITHFCAFLNLFFAVKPRRITTHENTNLLNRLDNDVCVMK